MDTKSQGFEFVATAIGDGKGADRVELGKHPLLVVTDLPKFEAAFPGAALAAINGTSIRTVCFDVVRRLVKAGIKAPDKLQEAQVARLRHQTVRTVRVQTVQVYILPDGTSTPDKATALAAWAEANAK